MGIRQQYPPFSPRAAVDQPVTPAGVRRAARRRALSHPVRYGFS